MLLSVTLSTVPEIFERNLRTKRSLETSRKQSEQGWAISRYHLSLILWKENFSACWLVVQDLETSGFLARAIRQEFVAADRNDCCVFEIVFWQYDQPFATVIFLLIFILILFESVVSRYILCGQQSSDFVFITGNKYLPLGFCRIMHSASKINMEACKQDALLFLFV